MKLIERIKAIKAILFADEYFVSVANKENPSGIKCDGPIIYKSIIYKYFTNTDRNVFYNFVKDYITKFNN